MLAVGALVVVRPGPAAVPPTAPTGGSSAVAPAAAGASAPAAVAAEAALDGWYADRARAYAAGDRASLAALHAPGSAVGRRDLRVLERYLARGLRVQGLRVDRRVLSVRPTSAAGWRVVVVDRTRRATAVHPSGRTWRLPRGPWVRRTMVLEPVAVGWRLVSATP